MIAISTKDKILKVEGLETKFDLAAVSNSLVSLLDSYLEARILQQLHYWGIHGYGIVLNGIRWIYKPIREWLSETIIGFTNWQVRKAIASLVEKEIIRREHLHDLHHGHNFAPKNRTYYYSLNYERLEELAQEHEMDETIETIRFVSPTNQFCDSLEKQFCDSTKIYTKNTSIENNSKDQSHPALPSECDNLNSIYQNKDDFNTSELSNELRQEENIGFNSEAIAEEISCADVDNKINQNISTNEEIAESIQESVQVEVEQPVTKPKLKTSKDALPNRKKRNEAPWKDEGQFKRFYRALIQALPIVANAHSPQGLAQTIIRQLRSGIPHSYWDDFIAGLPIGTSTMPEWEVEPGVPYPMFIEYLTEKLRAGNNTKTDEQTRNEVFGLLNKPRQAKAFWGQFKRSVVNVSKTIERDRALGVSNPATPVWTRERIEPSVEEAEKAGKKIMAVNGNAQAAIASASLPQLENEDIPSIPQSPSDPWNDDNSEVYPEGDKYPKPQPKSQPTLGELLTKRLGKRNLKGFMKQMPKVSKSEIQAASRASEKPKTNIAVMSITEINDYLSDPILRKQIAPQLMQSDYELISNEYGEIIGVKRPSSS